MNFRARNKNKVHPELVSSWRAKSRNLFDSVKRGCFKMERLTVRVTDDEIITLTDTFKFPGLATALVHSSCSIRLLAVSFEVSARLPAAFLDCARLQQCANFKSWVAGSIIEAIYRDKKAQ